MDEMLRHKNRGNGFEIGHKPHNRKYDSLETAVSCYVCSSAFMVLTKWYHFRIRAGKNRFACPSTVKGRRSECVKKLQSITIKEIRSTPESRAKTVEQMVTHWSHEKNRDAYGAKMKAKPREWPARRMAAVLKANMSGEMTKPERTINGYLIANKLPFKYVGDGAAAVGMLFPDFISTDGSRRIIEAFGCYWHGCQKCFPGSKSKGISKNQRLSTYKKHGYTCEIIWEHELADDPLKALARIQGYSEET